VSKQWTWVLAICIALLGLVAQPAWADEGLDYDVLARLALPWACDSDHRVTWGPTEHWEHGKASGIAFDFSMRTGTPLYAPADGMAYFLRDQRPFETNYGYYIELVVEDDWLIRLAHLRDEQSGERMVKAGELIGYSGSSGAFSEHLHLEVLARDGTRWVRPELDRITDFFGLPISTFVEGALIANEGCNARLAFDGAIQPVQTTVQLGEPMDLVVPLRNDGLEPFTLRTIQVSFREASGRSLVAEGRGEWTFEGKQRHAVAVRARPDMAGDWCVERVTCQGDAQTFALAAEGGFVVTPSPLKLVGLSVAPQLQVGDAITLEAWIENTGESDQSVDELLVQGARPDHVAWSASSGRASVIPAGGVKRVALRSNTAPQAVGEWKTTQIAYRQAGRTLVLGQPEQSFIVSGPELVIRRIAVYPSHQRLSVLLVVTNVGTDAIAPDAIEAWGWKPDGEHDFAMKNTRISSLAPGQSALIQLGATLDGPAGLWRLIEVGYWSDGRYVRLPLDEQLSVMVGAASETRLISR